jgi:hypothetical protein
MTAGLTLVDSPGLTRGRSVIAAFCSPPSRHGHGEAYRPLMHVDRVERRGPGSTLAVSCAPGRADGNGDGTGDYGAPRLVGRGQARGSAGWRATHRAADGLPSRWSSSPACAHAVVVSVLTPAEVLIAARRLAGARPHLAAVAGVVHHEDQWQLCRDELTGVDVRADGWDIRGRWFGVVVGATPRLGELPRGETIPWRVIAAQIAPGERRGSR